MAAAPAMAAIHPETNTPLGATNIATQIVATPGILVGASFTAFPPAGTPNGWEDAPLTQFPTHGSTFGILTSGDVNNVDDPGTFTSVSDGGFVTPPPHGNSAFDVSILKIDLNAPLASNCLTFDFKFLSEEFPVFVGSSFNDAFIAELDLNTWTAIGSNITAPNNFAFDANGDVVSINSTGIGGMTAAQGIGTAYDGNLTGPDTNGAATVLLNASTQITPGLHSLYLSIFDQGDTILDSAVFLDNLRIGFVPDPAVNCQPGAEPVNFQMTLEPAEDTNPVGTPHTVTATLTDENGDPVAGALIDFEASGANSATGADTTDSNGEAEFTYTGTNIGDDTITACYNADTDPACEATASAIKHWTVGAPATLTLDPKTAMNPVDTQHCVTATVRDIGGNPTPGITVRFSVTGSVTTSGSATTDANGEAEFCYNGPPLPGSDVITAYADTNNNNIQDPGEPSDVATKEWVLPVSTPLCEVKITNGGWITAANGDKSSFGGEAMADGEGNASGNEEYQDHGPTDPMNLHGNVLVVVCDSTTSATIFGQATVDGAGSFFYRLRVEDNAEPGKGADKYWILVANGYDSASQILKGGNVQIHLGS
jgi:hypothetical protein